MLFFITSCCRDDCSKNKIIVKEYDPMVIFKRNNPYSIDINLDGTNAIRVEKIQSGGELESRPD